MTRKTDGLGQPIDPQEAYFIQDSRQVIGNCILWWAHEGAGYTCDLAQAGVFSGNDAANQRETDIPWPVEHTRKAVVHHVRADHATMRRKDRLQIVRPKPPRKDSP